MYKGVIAFIGLQLTALAIVGLYPPLVNYLPNRVSFLSETAPPPRNPKLQYCLENYVGTQLEGDTTLSKLVADAKQMDLSVLPSDLAKDLTKGFESGEEALVSIQAAFDAEVAVAGAADVYRPKQIVVRRIEKQIRQLEAEAEELKKLSGRMRDESEAEKRAEMEAEREHLLAEVEELRGTIPDTWEEVHDNFAALTKAEQTARTSYRRQADSAWGAPNEVLAVLDGNDAFAVLETPLRELRAFIETTPEAEAFETVDALEDKFSDVEGAGDIKSALGKAERALKDKRNPDRVKALAEYDKALAEYEAQAEWRVAADAQLRPQLNTYLDGIRGTLGIRQQERLTREQALFMASCNAKHRDISLNF
jgi:cytochrome c556